MSRRGGLKLLTGVVLVSGIGASALYLYDPKQFTQLISPLTTMAITSSTTKQLHPLPPLPPPPSLPPVAPRSFTFDELKEFNGVDGKPIYLSCKNIVYEVSPNFYGPGKTYHVFAGKEATIPLGKVIVSGEECNLDWTKLRKDPTWWTTVNEWEEKYQKKYRVVGYTSLEECKAHSRARDGPWWRPWLSPASWTRMLMPQPAAAPKPVVTPQTMAAMAQKKSQKSQPPEAK